MSDHILSETTILELSRTLTPHQLLTLVTALELSAAGREQGAATAASELAGASAEQRPLYEAIAAQAREEGALLRLFAKAVDDARNRAVDQRTGSHA